MALDYKLTLFLWLISPCKNENLDIRHTQLWRALYTGSMKDMKWKMMEH